MYPWVEKSPAYLERWIDEQGVERSSVVRIVEGLDLSAGEEIPEHTIGQQPTVFIPGLSALPWWDNERFSWLTKLEAAAADITGEFETIGGLAVDRTVPNPAHLADKGRWTALYLYYAGKAYPKNIKACPKTIKALETIPGATGCGMCYFSIMDPHTHVAAHTGYTNAHLRCHLSLVTPKGCRIRVGDETRVWEQGKAFVFDDSFDHEVWNDSDSGRAVLLFDIWHPDLTEAEVGALSYLMGVWRKLLCRNFWSREMVGT
jgi:aspartyl/asparaginyl beta-hydroxylase (cupin superfamily)